MARRKRHHLLGRSTIQYFNVEWDGGNVLLDSGSGSQGLGLATFGTIEKYPGGEVVGEIGKAVFFSGSDKKDVARPKIYVFSAAFKAP
jgi:hypothetical protein